MLGLGLTLMGGILAQDSEDWTQTVMYHPSGNMRTLPPGSDVQQPLRSRYVAKLWQCMQSSRDIMFCRYTQYRVGENRIYAFGMGSVTDITFCRCAVAYFKNPHVIDMYMNAKAQQNYNFDTQLNYNPDEQRFIIVDFSYNPHSYTAYCDHQLWGSKSVVWNYPWDAVETKACLAPAAQHFGGAYYRNESRGVRFCALALSSAGVGNDYCGGFYNIETQTLTEL